MSQKQTCHLFKDYLVQKFPNETQKELHFLRARENKKKFFLPWGRPMLLFDCWQFVTWTKNVQLSGTPCFRE